MIFLPVTFITLPVNWTFEMKLVYVISQRKQRYLLEVRVVFFQINTDRSV